MWTRIQGFVACVLIALPAACGPASAQEGEWRWRLATSETRLSLYIAGSDGGTDDIGSPSLVCEKGKKVVKVTGTMGKSLKRALADAIVKGVYPLVEPVPDGRGGAGLLEPTFTDMDGWTYSFEMPVDAQAFEPFSESGILSFNFNGILIEEGAAAGLERIAEFHETCKRGSW